MNENEIFIELEKRGFDLENLTDEMHLIIANIVEITRDHFVKHTSK